MINYYEDFINDQETTAKTLMEYIPEALHKQLDSTGIITDQYVKDQSARIALSIGDVDNFLKYALPEEADHETAVETMQKALDSGDIDSLAKQFPEYASEIIKNYQNINNEIYNSITSGAGEYVEANQFNAAKLAALEQKGLLQKISGAGAEAVYKTIQMTNSTFDELLKIIQDDKNLSNDEKASQIQRTRNTYRGV